MFVEEETKIFQGAFKIEMCCIYFGSLTNRDPTNLEPRAFCFYMWVVVIVLLTCQEPHFSNTYQYMQHLF